MTTFYYITQIFSSLKRGKLKIVPAKVAIFVGGVYNGSMKKFDYAFPKLTRIMIYAGLAVCAAGFGINLYVCISDGVSHAVNPYLPLAIYILMFAVTIAAAGLLTAILLSSRYEVGEGLLTCAFGPIKSRYPARDIEAVVLDRETDKLWVSFKDDSYIAVVIKSGQYNDFVQAILDENGSVEYAIRSKESSPDGGDAKK